MTKFSQVQTRVGVLFQQTPARSGFLCQSQQTFAHYITLPSFHMPFTPEVTSGASKKVCTIQALGSGRRSFFRQTFASVTEVDIKECSKI